MRGGGTINVMTMNLRIAATMVLGIAISLFLAGCASVDGGQVAAGILQGVGAGLSGL